jgi:Tfp pilus assembly protein PilX
MRATRYAPAAGERGFMLVGVVMFMLALTILGLSLFSLSSYEAQFFTSAVSRGQSLQDAEGGMELVKALLQMEPQRLENAQLAVGQRGITSAIAYQWRSTLSSDTTSQGPVNWDSTIVMAVSARSGSAERSIQGRFIPSPGELPYTKLLAAGLGIRCNADNDTPEQGLELRGPVWQFVDESSDTAWTGDLYWPTGRPMITRSVPRPLGDAFVDSRLPAAHPPTYWSGDEGPYQLTFRNDDDGSPRFFRSPPTPGEARSDQESDWYSFFVDDDLTIRVRGIVVWVIPEGACFRRRVTVEPQNEGDAGALVIVAKANRRAPGHGDVGLWFQGGLSVSEPDLRVFLVSQDDIAITRAFNRSESLDARRVCVVAGGHLEIGGPFPGYRQRFLHENAMVSAAEALFAQGALPALSAGSVVQFAIARSTWSETTPR